MKKNKTLGMNEFVKIGNLEWQVNPPKETMSWQDGMDYAEKNGWRLPTRGEVVDLFDNHYEEMKELSDLDDTYWSATTKSANTQNAWYVYQSHGYTTSTNKTNGGSYRVRCVRASGNLDDLSYSEKENKITITGAKLYPLPVDYDKISIQEFPVTQRVIDFIRMYNCIAVTELDDILETLGDQKLLSTKGEKFRKELWTAFIKE